MRLEQLRGYVLEEVLCYLLKSSGYELLARLDVDGDELFWLGNGLNVRGRGADHQADVLGQFVWTPAFSRPLRLFVEAKFRGSPIGAEEVREAVGILSDLNTRYSGWGQGPLVRRHSYRYAIFSASGFTTPATQFAIAHEISLVDLRDGAFAQMLSAVRDNVPAINNAMPDGRTGAKPTVVLRAVLRALLNTDGGPAPAKKGELLGRIIENLPSDARQGADPRAVHNLISASRNLVDAVVTQQPILVGMPQAPFFLAMRPSRLRGFMDYVERRGDHHVHMDAEISAGQVAMKLWPVDSYEYELRFSLPGELARYVLDSVDESARLRSVKRQALAHITTTAVRGGQLRPVRLLYEPRPRSRSMLDGAGK
ncbi:restriction endonuclease [Cellulosimicrobium cellulans]|uniref:restriction endonuclease n=1 Tax=Cellulosimicrobium cellulans TaxID=1710 RepID=UPI003C58E638